MQVLGISHGFGGGGGKRPRRSIIGRGTRGLLQHRASWGRNHRQKHPSHPQYCPLIAGYVPSEPQSSAFIRLLEHPESLAYCLQTSTGLLSALAPSQCQAWPKVQHNREDPGARQNLKCL